MGLTLVYGVILLACICSTCLAEADSESLRLVRLDEASRSQISTQSDLESSVKATPESEASNEAVNLPSSKVLETGNGQRREGELPVGHSEGDETTNPPFPSQSSSFWDVEVDEPGRDYDDPPQTDDIIVEDVNTKEKLSRASNGISAADKNDTARPNIILIITDDQDIELGSMEYMPETLKVFRTDGIEFRHGYVSTPICCPSRSSLLTGLYVHNHEVFTNNDNCSSISWREKYEKKTFASYLWTSGYYTSYIGKYLNKYDGSHIPHGWDEWNGLLMNSRYYNYTLNRNGKRFRYGNDLERDYYPDSIARDGLDFLDRVASDPSKRPFLLVLSFPSPHGPEDSSPKFSNLFFNATPHHIPSYNYAPNPDKQWILRVTDKMTPMLHDFTNLLMTKRLQTLQSVDIAVRDIFQKLEATSMRDSTYSFYTSDHGYHVGNFGLVKGKSMPYEFDIRVPFFLAGPNSMVRGGTLIREPVLNIDFAPTFLDLAGIPIPDEMDGKSILPLIKKYCSTCQQADEPLDWPDVFLIESPGRRMPPAMTNSPLGTESGENFEKQSSKKFHKRKKERLVFDDDEVLSLTNLCSLHPHPCRPGQKKYCRKEKNRIRFRKCRQNIDFLISSRFFGPDPRINDALYTQNISFPEEALDRNCSCRIRRSTGLDYFEDDSVIDWETERRRIDDEIEKLKQRIEYLRQRRREMRRKWISDTYAKPGTVDGAAKIHGERRHRMRDRVNDTEQTSGFTDDPILSREDYDDSSESDEVDRDEKHDREMETIEDQDGSGGGYKRPNPTTNDEVHSGSDVIQFELNVETELAPPELTTNGSSPEADFKDNQTITVGPPPVDNRPDDESDLNGVNEAEDQSRGEILGSTRKPTSSHRGRNKHSRNKFKGIYLFNKTPDPTIPTSGTCECYNDPRWLRQKEREDRKHKKLLSKLRKKQRIFKRIDDPFERQQAETCGKEEKMNCFWHDKDHWRTEPFWTGGSFCFCMNANNNSYSCLRSVNATHNYLYCQFVTGFKMYFDLIKDPYQLRNAINTLPAENEDWILARLYKLKQCKGRDECWSDDTGVEDSIHPSLWEQIFGRLPKKRRRGGGRRRKAQGT